MIGANREEIAAPPDDLAGLLPAADRSAACSREPITGRTAPSRRWDLAGRQRGGLGRGRHQPQRRRARLGGPDRSRGLLAVDLLGFDQSRRAARASLGRELAGAASAAAISWSPVRDAAFVVHATGARQICRRRRSTPASTR